ncbi:predicted protein [Naegleria gruberi]|uniref:Predicted protein n=1 Tax=Naegleria gruberi TaxID=5762 RepID=D2W6I1_NAEGR|nr:uncharacterized protein NAEGRDRAFT_77025 [Naegleria gruberi]EFC35321.1 predicted protein [Naegleria gruberi]|eukprot:XP_002668065.1 predicted protein [Naegleria gruberi strain NEG-M]
MSIVKKLFGGSPSKQPSLFKTSIYRKSDPFYNFINQFSENDLIQPLISSSLLPLPVDVKESDKEFELLADIPGFSKNEINCLIDQDKHLLTLKGEKKEENEENEGNYIIKERYYNSFTRHFDIPSNVNLDQIKAQLKNGQLKLTIPKLENQNETENVNNIKNIEINTLNE